LLAAIVDTSVKQILKKDSAPEQLQPYFQRVYKFASNGLSPRPSRDSQAPPVPS